MLKKLIKYVDYNGTEREEEFCFNLNETELAEMEVSVSGGVQQMIEKIKQTQDGQKIIDTIKGFIMRAYGERSPDGRQFIKSEELSRTFIQTEAYNVLFLELMTVEGAASTFVNACVPDPDVMAKRLMPRSK